MADVIIVLIIGAALAGIVWKKVKDHKEEIQGAADVAVAAAAAVVAAAIPQKAEEVNKKV